MTDIRLLFYEQPKQTYQINTKVPIIKKEEHIQRNIVQEKGKWKHIWKYCQLH